jgi:hypothetical protein
VVAAPAARLSALAAEGQERGVTVLVVGEAVGERIEIAAAETELSVALADAGSAWRSLRPA